MLKVCIFFIGFVGGPLLLMELAFLLRGVGAQVVWITNQKPVEADEVVYSLEHRMLDRGVQVDFFFSFFSDIFFILSQQVQL